MREDSFFLNSHLEIMPFTLSHAVAVIPLYKYLGKFGAMSALVIGSMTPDVAYLVPFLVDYRMDSHSLVGVYLFCLPVGLTVYYLYHFLMAPVLVSILPRGIQKHLQRDLFIGRIPDIPAYTLILSIVIGALTHVFWDFFTHAHGLPRYIAWMNTPLMSVDSYDIMPYRILQHLSSILGLSLLIFWIVAWLRRQKTPDEHTSSFDRHYWQASTSFKRIILLLMLSTSLLAAVLYGYMNLPQTSVMYGMYSLQVFIRFAIVGFFGAFIMNSVLFGCYFQYKFRSTL